MRLFATILSILLLNTIASAQNAGGLTDLLKANVEGPFVVMDLVKFKPGGEEKYAIYDGIVEEKLKSLGGAVVFRGTARKVGTSKLNGTEDEVDHTTWDRVTFRKYPSMQAVMDMAGSSESQGAFPNRVASVDASFVYAFSGEMPSFEGGPPPRNFPMPVLSPPPSADTVYMLNLLRFAGDAGRAQYFSEYGPATTPLISKRGGRVVNVDVTIICEAPKIGPNREAMAARVAGILGLRRDAVCVKATTTERLGFTGRGEGIAAQAVATIMLPANRAAK